MTQEHKQHQLLQGMLLFWVIHACFNTGESNSPSVQSTGPVPLEPGMGEWSHNAQSHG